MLNYLTSKKEDIKRDQSEVLTKILVKAGKTEIGTKYNFKSISGYEQFRDAVPIMDYSDVGDAIERMKKGESDVLWPGVIKSYAVSAGTTGDGKHIPLSKERLECDQRFMRKVFTSYALQRPNLIPFIGGGHVSLPGQLSGIPGAPDDVKMGEVSAFLAQDSPEWLKIFQVHDPDQMIYQDWDKKFQDVLSKSINSDIRQITAVPSWVLTLFQEALKKTGKKKIKELWPNLRLIITGGEGLGSYIPHFNELCEGMDVDYVENYGASEGYLAYADDLEKDDMFLMTDNGLFYEWVPNPPSNKEELKEAKAIPTWDVEKDTPYAVLVTNNSGLYRYILNDLIEFTDTEVPRISVIGRVTDMLDRFGEAVEIHEINNALEHAKKETGAEIGVFTIGAMLESGNDKPMHVWFIQWAKEPENPKKFIELLDQSISKQNRHYANRRKSGSMNQIEMHTLTDSILSEWKENHLKTGAQTKIPQVLQDEDQVKSLRELCNKSVAIKE